MTAADQELARRCQEGHADAFEELYRRHAGRLYGLALRMTGSEADAADLVQEMFLQAHRKLVSYRGESALGTWLYRLGMNLCLDHLRGRSHRMARATDSLDEAPGPGLAAPGDAGLGPLHRLDLERAIAALPPGYRAAFVLHDVEGFEHREIAGMLGISEGTSKSQVHKARLRLRAMLVR